MQGKACQEGAERQKAMPLSYIWSLKLCFCHQVQMCPTQSNWDSVSGDTMQPYRPETQKMDQIYWCIIRKNELRRRKTNLVTEPKEHHQLTAASLVKMHLWFGAPCSAVYLTPSPVALLLHLLQYACKLESKCLPWRLGSKCTVGWSLLHQNRVGFSEGLSYLTGNPKSIPCSAKTNSTKSHSLFRLCLRSPLGNI